MSYTVRVELQVRDYASALGMEHRRAIKRAITQLKLEQGDIKALGDDLEGFYRLRVGPFRVIFRYRTGRVIECVYMNRRSVVYEVFEREVIDRLKGGGK
ncbi:MAG TPA: cytotoxic translational repressor of toxin-antitoxin stability system [Rariglobus sp.]|nr:cytotoxic translational repressor of toxin-antitoxin stability system [Rariglobus sp.]